MAVSVWGLGLVTAWLVFQIASVPALLMKRNDLADAVWGPAFLISALAAAQWGTADGLASLSHRSVLILVLLGVWALRLFAHVGWRILSHGTEDVRYRNWREQWGRNWVWRSYLQVFVLQAFILFVILAPVLHSISSPDAPLSWVAWTGVAVWLLGFGFELVADEQLRRFKVRPENKGRLMTTGLWSWSRHPNYFGETLQWWGIWLLVLDLPFGWATALSPVGITFLLLRVSGVPLLEATMMNRPGFEDYARNTPKFFPVPPIFRRKA
jgi:steroid 5-alpha reductase family enzyme